MSKIVCLGCSFTAGTNSESSSWVKSLAKLHPEHKFYNLALAGSSLLHSIWILEEFLKIDKPDLIIFQITTAARLTYYKEEEIDRNGVFSFMRSIKNYNYMVFPNSIVSCINRGTLENRILFNYDKSRILLATMYYSKLSKEKTFDVEYRALFTHVKKISDICFYHLERDINDPDTLSIEKILGKEKFKSFVIDGDGNHFGQDGADWQAQFISKNYLSKLK
jgi:hypothetical protein